jgi:hypothetical protein
MIIIQKQQAYWYFYRYSPKLITIPQTFISLSITSPPSVISCLSNTDSPDSHHGLAALTITGDAIFNRILRIQRLKTAA